MLSYVVETHVSEVLQDVNSVRLVSSITASAARPSSGRSTSPLSDLSELEDIKGVTITSASKAESSKKTVRRKKVKEVVEPDPADYPSRVETPWKIGAHVSAAGGVENAIINAAEIGQVVRCFALI